MVYGCLYCPLSYQETLTTLNSSKTLKEEKREELFENLKSDGSIGCEVDVIDPRELSAKMLKMQVYMDTGGDAKKYRIKLFENFHVKDLIAIIRNAPSALAAALSSQRAGEVIAHVAEGNVEDIKRVVVAARKAFDEGSWPNYD
ncbi:hypothetical protein Cni_G16909 [Canna indica]|uniref:Ribonuclease n=1 Tax=Canna indica TaxID=4628 RepID=A0AAQ3KGA5_9LILI|nr:hypothetical protein Cni_G16909 [Canna indica]